MVLGIGSLHLGNYLWGEVAQNEPSILSTNKLLQRNNIPRIGEPTTRHRKTGTPKTLSFFGDSGQH